MILEVTKHPRHWRLWNGPTIKIKIQWEPRDLWMGCFWRRTDSCLHLYICIVPTLPLYITRLRSKERMEYLHGRSNPN